MVRLAFGDKVMMVIIYIFLALLAFVTFYPF
ncbi:carbohydrate ABC transporter permease, partial [Clostridium perfringens]